MVVHFDPPPDYLIVTDSIIMLLADMAELECGARMEEEAETLNLEY